MTPNQILWLEDGLRSAFDDADEDAPGMEDEFAFGLERVLDGVETLVRARRRPARRRTASR